MGTSSPDVPFTKIMKRLTFLGEQFWGRAARASNDSRESDARFFTSPLTLGQTLRLLPHSIRQPRQRPACFLHTDRVDFDQ